MRFVKMVQLLLVIAVVSQVGAVVTSLSSSSGLVIQDNGGTSYDIDALLDEGKHIVLQSSNGT